MTHCCVILAVSLSPRHDVTPLILYTYILQGKARALFTLRVLFYRTALCMQGNLSDRVVLYMHRGSYSRVCFMYKLDSSSLFHSYLYFT